MRIGQINCGRNVKNTGTGKCAFDLGYARKFFRLADEDHVFTQEELDAWEDTLRAGILADPSERIYPLPNWEAITDNSDERSFNTMGYGRKTPGAKTFNDWTFDYLDGAHCAYVQLQSHDGSGVFLPLDSNGRFWGLKVDGGFKGIPMDQITLDPKLSDGTSPTKYAVRYIVDPVYLGEGLVPIEKVAGFQPLLLEGLQDILLETADGSTATIVQVTATTGCNYTDLGTLFATALQLEANWVGVLVSNNTSVAPTSAVYNANTGVFTLTFSGPVKSVTLVSAAALAAAGIDGFEANILTGLVDLGS